MNKETRGGFRPNSGRKSPFKTKTKQVKFMPPETKVAELKAMVKKKFAAWVKEGL